MSNADRIVAVVIGLLFALIVGGLTHVTRPTPANSTSDRALAHLL